MDEKVICMYMNTNQIRVAKSTKKGATEYINAPLKNPTTIIYICKSKLMIVNEL